MPESTAPQGTHAPLALEWKGDHLLRIGDVEFYVTVALDELHAHQSRRNHFLLGKTRGMIDAVLALRETEDIRRILDIGIFKGGSAALFDGPPPESVQALGQRVRPSLVDLFMALTRAPEMNRTQG